MIIKQAFSPKYCYEFCNIVEKQSQYKVVNNIYKNSNVIEFTEMTQNGRELCERYLNTIARDAIETFRATQISSECVNSIENSNLNVSNYVFEKLEPGSGVSNKRHDIGLSVLHNKPHVYVYTILLILNTVQNAQCTVSISHQDIKVNIETGNCVFIPCGVENTFSINNKNGDVPLYFMTCNILTELSL